MSVALPDRQHENPRLAGSLDDTQRVNVCAVLDARCEAPRATEQEAAVGGHRFPRPRPLSGDDRKAIAAEQLVDGRIAEVRGAGADGEGRGHQHPSCGGVAVGQVLDHFERRDRVELGAAANRARHPHSEEPVAMQRLDDWRRQASLFVTSRGMLVGEGGDGGARAAPSRVHGRSSQFTSPHYFVSSCLRASPVRTRAIDVAKPRRHPFYRGSRCSEAYSKGT